MTPDALAALRARDAGLDMLRAMTGWVATAVVDRLALLAEVDRLTAELDRLHAEHAECDPDGDGR